MLALLTAYYTSDTAFSALSQFAELKRTHGVLFVIAASVAAGALIPELFLVLFFQRGRPSLRNLRNLAFTVPVWGFDGTLVDLLYRSEAAWFGDVATLPVVAAKFVSTSLATIPFSPRRLESSPTNGKQRFLAAADSRSFHVETLLRQDHSDLARHMGSLDSVDGNYLFPASCPAISTIRAGAYFLGVASHLHDKSLRWKN